MTIFGVDAVLLLVAVLYLLAAGLCMTLPSYRPPEARPPALRALGEGGRAVASVFGQLREGLTYIRSDHSIFWALTYLGITASLIGVLGVLGPGFATKALGLREQDFVVVVLPIGAGLVIGILALNVYGKFIARRRVIQGGLLVTAAVLVLLNLVVDVLYAVVDPRVKYGRR